MKFNTVAEAFNFYKNHTNDQLEARANEINHMIETDENVDIQALNVELTGIAQAKRNNDEKAQKPEKRIAPLSSRLCSIRSSLPSNRKLSMSA